MVVMVGMHKELMYNKLTLEDLNKFLNEGMIDDFIYGESSFGVRDLGDGLYEISTGKTKTITNLKGLEEFDKAMQDYAKEYLKNN